MDVVLLPCYRIFGTGKEFGKKGGFSFTLDSRSPGPDNQCINAGWWKEPYEFKTYEEAKTFFLEEMHDLDFWRICGFASGYVYVLVNIEYVPNDVVGNPPPQVIETLHLDLDLTKKPGRPAMLPEGTRRVNMMLDLSDIDYLREIGRGSITLGVRFLVASHRSKPQV